eukprot:Gb_05833 [translate_table: standard]
MHSLHQLSCGVGIQASFHEIHRLNGVTHCHHYQVPHYDLRIPESSLDGLECYYQAKESHLAWSSPPQAPFVLWQQEH